MFINKEGKLFNKISIIDIIVIIALIVAGFGIYARYLSPNQKVSTVNQKIEYTMLIKDVRRGTVSALEKLGPIYSDETKEYLGEIINVSAEQATKSMEMPNGEFKLMILPDKFDVTITVNVDGKVNSEGFYTSTNQAITVGSNHVLNAKFVKTTGEIKNIREIK